MRTFMKYAAVAAFAGALAVASAVPSQARSWHHHRYNGVGVGAGFVAGALLGAAAVNSGYYGGQGYYDPGYAYGPDYGAYAYEPAPGYGAAARLLLRSRLRIRRSCGRIAGVPQLRAV